MAAAAGAVGETDSRPGPTAETLTYTQTKTMTKTDDQEEATSMLMDSSRNGDTDAEKCRRAAGQDGNRTPSG